MTDRKTAPKIIDVVPANNSAPSDTAKPIIVTNRPLMQDPMMVEAPDDTTEPAKLAAPTVATLTRKNIVQPLTISPPEPAPTSATVAAENTLATAAAAEATTNQEPELEAKDKVKDPDAESKEAEAAAAREVALQALVESKRYYVPINSLEKRRAKRVVAAGIVLSVLLACAWADIALDAGLIHLGGIKAFTHFFSS